MFIIKFWIKWGLVCEILTSGCEIMPEKTFWAHLPQIYVLGPSPHVRLNLNKNSLASVDHEILSQMMGCFWKSDKRFGEISL